MDASESVTGPGLLAFAEDPDAFLLLGPDEERVVTDRSIVTFSPGEHFWSTTVARFASATTTCARASPRSARS